MKVGSKMTSISTIFQNRKKKKKETVKNMEVKERWVNHRGDRG